MLWPPGCLKNVMHAGGDIDGYQVTSRVCGGCALLAASYGNHVSFFDIDVTSMVFKVTSMGPFLRAAASRIDVLSMSGRYHPMSIDVRTSFRDIDRCRIDVRAMSARVWSA